MKYLLEVDQVRKTFIDAESSREVLKGVSFQVLAGEFVALIGRSGSGKSTLLNCLAGIDQPTDGKITIKNWNMTQATERERTRFRRANVGFVFQSFHLIPTLTVLENVRLPLDLNGVPASEADARSAEYLRLVGLSGREKSFTDRLSGGEQQRVALARALVHHPLLVLADEPTGNLDQETGQQCLELLNDLRRKSSSAVLMVTHSLDAAELSDRVLRMESGLLVEASAVSR